MTKTATYRIGIDIGGTFTDFVVVDSGNRERLWKEDSDPVTPIVPIKAGLEAVASQLGLSLAEFLSRTELLVHGTTIATNILIQRNGPKLGLLTTEGFRDVLYFRDGYKPERFNVHLKHPEPLIERYLRLPVRERIDRSGNIRTPLDEASVAAAVEKFKAAGVEAVAIGFLWSVINPVHEKRAAELVQSLMPGVSVVCSSDIIPQIREWQRISAATLSAYILPKVGNYLNELETFLTDSGATRKPLIMQINGGCSSVAEILHRPVNILASGPAAAPAAARYYAQGLDIEDIVCIDMGGTSLDIALVHGGQTKLSRDIRVEDQPVGVAGVEVLSIGAGGGSIAWVDNGGALRVGPQSAGARPGPAAYGQGGVEPTVTDANLVLGNLHPDHFLGGRRRLDLEKSRAAIESRVAGPLGMSVEEAAAGILRIVNANMVNAIRAISVQRGIDIRKFTMMVGGGAGGLHGVALARELGISTVLIPREAGTLCAFGMTVTDVRCDEMAVHYALSSKLDLAALDEVLAGLRKTATARLLAQGFAEKDIALEWMVDARYGGQVHELTIPAAVSLPFSAGNLKDIENAFHAQHTREFTWARPEMPVEFLHWRVTAVGRTQQSAGPAALGKPAAGEAAEPTASRRVYSPIGKTWSELPAYRSEDLLPGRRILGPAVLQADTTTVVVEAGDSIMVGNNLEIIANVSIGRDGKSR